MANAEQVIFEYSTPGRGATDQWPDAPGEALAAIPATRKLVLDALFQEQLTNLDERRAAIGVLDVELEDLHLAAHLAGDRVDVGHHRLARGAPLRPEVHDNRAGGVQHLGVERVVSDILERHESVLSKRKG